MRSDIHPEPDLDGPYSWMRLGVCVVAGTILSVGMWGVILILPQVQDFLIDLTQVQRVRHYDEKIRIGDSELQRLIRCGNEPCEGTEFIGLAQHELLVVFKTDESSDQTDDRVTCYCDLSELLIPYPHSWCATFAPFTPLSADMASCLTLNRGRAAQFLDPHLGIEDPMNESSVRARTVSLPSLGLRPKTRRRSTGKSLGEKTSHSITRNMLFRYDGNDPGKY